MNCNPMHLTVLFLLPFFAVGQENEEPKKPMPRELTELLGRFETRRKVEVQAPTANQTKTLHAKYLKALAEAEAKAIDGGDLDTVTDVRAEKARIHAGLPVDPTTPLKSAEGIRLQRAYSVQAAKIDANRKSLEAELGVDLSEALTELQTNLVRQGRIEDAVDVRDFRQGTAYTAFLGGVSAKPAPPERMEKAPAPKQAIAPEPERIAPVEELVFPPRIPQSPPPLPTEKCKLVIVPAPDGPSQKEERTLKTMSHLARETESADWVKLGDSMVADYVIAIRASGEVVEWTERGKREHPGPFSQALINYGLPLVTLSASGRIHFHGEFEGKEELETLTNIVSISACQGVLAALDSSGRVRGAGSRAGLPAFKAIFAQSEPSCQANLLHAQAISLRKDGQVKRFHNGGSVLEGSDIARLLFLGAVDKDGGFQLPLRMPPPVLDAVRESSVSVKNVRAFHLGATVVIGHGGAPILHLYDPDSEKHWSRAPKFEQALAGAVDVCPLIHRNKRWFVALLPANTVPRSGLWDVDELISARSQTQ